MQLTILLGLLAAASPLTLAGMVPQLQTDDQTINFDDLASQASVPRGYAQLRWHGARVASDPNAPIPIQNRSGALSPSSGTQFARTASARRPRLSFRNDPANFSGARQYLGVELRGFAYGCGPAGPATGNSGASGGTAVGCALEVVGRHCTDPAGEQTERVQFAYEPMFTPGGTAVMSTVNETGIEEGVYCSAWVFEVAQATETKKKRKPILFLDDIQVGLVYIMEN